MLGILYLIKAFVNFSTVLMMTAERQREFGVMIAVGMQKLKLAGIVVIELIFIGILGTVSGMLASIPGIIIGHNNPVRLLGELAESMESFGMEPVMPFALIDTYFFNQALVVIVIILVDEPTANLDSKSTSTLLDIMERLNEEEKVTVHFLHPQPASGKKSAPCCNY